MLKKGLSIIMILLSVFILVGCEGLVSYPYTIDEITASIEIDYADGDQSEYVTQNITLPTTSELDDNAVVSWFSLYPDVVSNEGYVTRGDADQYVVLTATIDYAKQTSYVNFTMTVIGLNDSSTYRITFDSQGGSDVDSIIAYEGADISAPTDPTRDGYQFVGWYTTVNYSTQYTFNKMPSGDITLYAKWNYIDTNVYKITFDSNGGSAVTAISNNGGVAINAPADPTKEGYNFVGWYSDQTLTSLYSFGYMPYESITLYAKWLEINSTVYTGYYESITGLSGTSLRNELHAIINSGFHGVTYGDARYDLDDTDADPNISGNVILLYLGTSVSGVWDGGATWNREHIWPQYYLDVDASNSVVNAASDLQNLKPANPSTNSSRSNKWYGDSTTSYSYEPRDEVKGDIARILFYMDIMYTQYTLVDLEGSEDPALYEMGDLSVLLQWTIDDPVDDFERARNEMIYGYQGNRNPFIDHPELVQYIWS